VLNSFEYLIIKFLFKIAINHCVQFDSNFQFLNSEFDPTIEVSALVVDMLKLKMIDLLVETKVSVLRIPEIPLWTFSFPCLLLEMSRITCVQINASVRTSTFPLSFMSVTNGF